MSARRAAPVLAAALLLAAPALARASEADAFENKIAPISGQLYGTARRLELEPFFALSLMDPFYAKYFGGLRVAWHFSEAWSVAGSFQGGASSPTSSTTLCTAAQGCSPSSPQQQWQVPGDIKWIASAEGRFTPVYGKINILSSLVVHLDFTLLAGVDYVASQEVLNASDAALTAAAGGKPGTAGSLGGHFGLGTHIFLGDVVALSLELRDYLYSTHVGNLDERKIQNQLFLELGVSFFLGRSAR
jgi:outer membrane beta-barrel protein